MLRAMVFIDMENFDIAKYNYYKSISAGGCVNAPKINYSLMSENLVKAVHKDAILTKTLIFAPKPDDFLMQDATLKSKYEWISKLNNRNYISVIEGRHVARPAKGIQTSAMDINNRNTYYIVEKGTDVNLASNVIFKAASDAFDIAIIVSGDTDYMPVLDILGKMGKLVAIVGVKNQSLSSFKPISDIQVVLDDVFFQTCKI